MQPTENSRAFLHKLLQHPPILPFEPALLPMLFAMTREDSTASTRDLAKLIERSQNLASRVLALANSAAYGLAFKVSALHRAISILGIREIRRMVLLVGISSAIRETKLP
ncbi:MAG: HDOD domain-containing protein, partial [Desulfovibrionaceae bacterium]|nr:HDOD domain-containing protein [Desulfovibrionaceae bacterium]